MSSASSTDAVDRQIVDLDRAEAGILSSACSILRTSDAAEKAARTRTAAQEWRQQFDEVSAFSASCSPRQLPAKSKRDPVFPPARPARPSKPILQNAGTMPKRKHSGKEGRITLLHALAHIELNAIDLAWDIVARFAIDEAVPMDFIRDWISVADDEARHFLLLCDRLSELGANYGDLPAHDGLWEAAQITAHDLAARLAVVPLVLEARGLDVSPDMIKKLRHGGDAESADVLQIIYEDEIGHVAIGSRWFRWICDKRRVPAQQNWQQLVQQYFHGNLKPPFNKPARDTANLPQDWYLGITTV